MIIARRGLASASVAISPSPFRGVLPVPIAALRSSWPVLRNPANRNRAVPLTYEQFRYAFGNTISEDEARQLHETHSVPGSGATIFQAAAAAFVRSGSEALTAGIHARGPQRRRSAARTTRFCFGRGTDSSGAGPRPCQR